MAKGSITFVDSHTYLPKTEFYAGRYPYTCKAIGDIYIGVGQWAGSDGFAHTFTIDEFGNIGPNMNEGLEFNTANSYYHKCEQVEEGLVLVVARAGSTGTAWTLSVDENGNVAETHEFAFTGVWYTGGMCKVADRIYAVVGREADDDGWLQILNVDGSGTITNIDSVEFSGGSNCIECRIVHLVDEMYVIMAELSSGLQLYTIEISAAGAISAEGVLHFDQVDFGGSVSGAGDICKVSDTIIACSATTGNAVTGQLVTMQINSDTGIITELNLDQFGFSDNCLFSHIAWSTYDDLYTILWNDGDGSNTLHMRSVLIADDGTITNTGEAQISPTTTLGDPVYQRFLGTSINTSTNTYQSLISLDARSPNAARGCKILTAMVDHGVNAGFVCGGAGIGNFTAEMLGDSTGVLLQWDVGRACPTCSGSTAGNCKVTIQYSTDGTPHQTPNTPPYVVRDLIQPQCTQRAYWHANTSHVNYFYSAWVYYETTNEWLGPFNPTVTPTLPAVSGSIEPFISGSLSFTKLGTNTKLSTRQDIVADVIVWLPESQSEREPAIEAAMKAVSPAHTKLNVMYERYYIAQTTTEQFSIADYDATVHTVQNGTIVNRKATIDSSYDGLATILGD